MTIKLDEQEVPYNNFTFFDGVSALIPFKKKKVLGTGKPPLLSESFTQNCPGLFYGDKMLQLRYMYNS